MKTRTHFLYLLLTLTLSSMFLSCDNSSALPTLKATVEKETILLGEQTTIKIDGLDTNTLIFQSKSDVLSVDANGIATGEQAGIGVIEITHISGATTTVSIKVVEHSLDIASFDVKLEKQSINLGERTRVIANTSLEDKTFMYKATNDLVDIDENGNITPLMIGNEKITVSHSSGYSKIVELIIKPLPTSGDIKVESKNLTVSPKGGSYSFSIKKENFNTSYAIEGIQDFISLSIEKGELEDIVTVHVDKNNSRLDKYATLVIKNSKNKEKARIEITQEMNLDSKITYYWFGGVNANNSIEYIKSLPGVNELALEVKESANTMFYNAKKMSMTGPDKDMCGTYTASNMAHWFLAQNQDNIEKFKAINNIEDPEFARNGYDYSKDAANMSTIAQYFKNANYMQEYPHIAIEWLLAGKELKGYKNGPGWFSSILKDNADRYLSIDPTASKNDLERIVFNAYKENAVLSMNYFYTPTAQHAVNIWGFGVDEENNVVELFQADSNIQNNALTNIGIYYKKNESQPYLYNLSAKKGYEKTNWKIMDLTTLYNGRDLFDEYFRSIH